jgi:hypothetical protein
LTLKLKLLQNRKFQSKELKLEKLQVNFTQEINQDPLLPLELNLRMILKNSLTGIAKKENYLQYQRKQLQNHQRNDIYKIMLNKIELFKVPIKIILLNKLIIYIYKCALVFFLFS